MTRPQRRILSRACLIAGGTCFLLIARITYTCTPLFPGGGEGTLCDNAWFIEHFFYWPLVLMFVLIPAGLYIRAGRDQELVR